MATPVPTAAEIDQVLQLLLDRGYDESDRRMVARFLVAHHTPHSAAQHMITHYEWRATHYTLWPQSICSLADIQPALKLKSAFIHGVDKKGRPVLYIRSCLHDPSVDKRAMEAYAVFLIEEAVARTQLSGRENFSVVIDMTNFAYRNVDHQAVAHLLGILKANYPERLSDLYIFNEGWLTTVVWKVIELLIDARIRRKIHFLGHQIDRLLEAVDAAELPTWIGGSCERQFSPEDAQEYVIVRTHCYGSPVIRTKIAH